MLDELLEQKVSAEAGLGDEGEVFWGFFKFSDRMRFTADDNECFDALGEIAETLGGEITFVVNNNKADVFAGGLGGSVVDACLGEGIAGDKIENTGFAGQAKGLLKVTPDSGL